MWVGERFSDCVSYVVVSSYRLIIQHPISFFLLLPVYMYPSENFGYVVACLLMILFGECVCVNL